MNTLKGVNAGVIKTAEGVPVIALKMSDSSDSESLILLPPGQLQEVMFAMFSGYRSLLQRYQQSPEQIQEQVKNDSQLLSTNVPEISADELNINIERCVTSFAPKLRQDRINLLFLLQNGENAFIALTYTQIEYVLSVLIKTLQSAENEQLVMLCLTMNDFIPLYVTSFNEDGDKGINYNQFTPEEWKSELFNTYHSLLFIQPDGKIPCGAIIKADPEFPEGRIEFIGQILLHNNSQLKQYQEQKMTVVRTRMNIPAGEENQERLLREHIAHRTTKLG